MLPRAREGERVGRRVQGKERARGRQFVQETV